jgi:hypothetical protein
LWWFLSCSPLPSLPTPHKNTTITTSCTIIFTTQHTFNYGTFGNSDGRDIGWVVMVVVVMVRYWWCWWSSDGGGGDEGCFNSGSCE